MRFAAAFIIVLLAAWVPRPHSPAASQDGIAVYFSPDGGCTAAVVHQIQNARKSIDVQAYGFTSIPIVHALADAEGRGVRVRVVLDRRANGKRYSAATYLAAHGVHVWLDGRHAIAHDKIIILDGSTVITGSFNFTKSAETRNAENLIIIEGRPLIAAAYEANFERHRGHSEREQQRCDPLQYSRS